MGDVKLMKGYDKIRAGNIRRNESAKIGFNQSAEIGRTS